jgi:hypothetical protein
VYNEKSFSGCMFNPLSKRKMVDAYPRLNEIILPEWNGPELDSLIRYTICVYDPKSVLAITERDLNYRKGLAAELAGIDMSDDDFITSVYTCTHKFTDDPSSGGLVDFIIRFLMRFIKSKEWAAIVIVENCFWESAKKLMEPITGKNSKEELEAVQKKSAIKDELDKDIARLEKYHKLFFGEDDVLQEAVKTKMTPESIAKMIK